MIEKSEIESVAAGDPPNLARVIELDQTLADSKMFLGKASELGEAARIAAASAAEAKTAAESSAQGAAETQRQIAAALGESQAKLSEIQGIASLALAAKTQIADAQSVIATKSEHIQDAQEHADRVRADLDRALTAATQQATATEGQKNSAQASSDGAAALLANVRGAVHAIESDASTVASSRSKAEESTAVTRALADKANTIETRIAGYETRLAELEAACSAHLATIVKLLPGATTAGLAHSFNERRTTFLKPQTGWQKIFVGSVLAIVILALTGMLHFYWNGTAPTYDELVRIWLGRLPIGAALVWLALHASRESALAKRLEEDYGFKAAIASCFEGFKKQMAETGAVDPNSALGKLLANTLNEIASQPGRIYDKHQLTTSPTAELTEAAKAAATIINPTAH